MYFFSGVHVVFIEGLCGTGIVRDLFGPGPNQARLPHSISIYDNWLVSLLHAASARVTLNLLLARSWILVS